MNPVSVSSRNHQWLLRHVDPANLSPAEVDASLLKELPAVLEMAGRHAVLGTVLARLEAYQKETGKPFGNEAGAAISQARTRWFVSVSVSLALRQEANRVLDAFSAAGIPVAVLKGHDFSDRLYADPGLRPFRDIDVLIHRADWTAAAELLEGLGLKPLEKALKHDDSEYGEASWISTGPIQAEVELHWNLINSPRQREHCSVTLDDVELQSTNRAHEVRLSPASLLLMGAVHTAHGHRFDYLQQLCDVRQICRQMAGPLDLDWLRDAALRCGAVTPLIAVLSVTARLLKSQACAEVLAALDLPGPRSMWNVLVRPGTVLQPQQWDSRLRRVAMREILKRAA